MKTYIRKVGKTLLFGLAILAIAGIVYLIVLWNTVNIWLYSIGILAFIGVIYLIKDLDNYYFKKRQKELRNRYVLKD